MEEIEVRARTWAAIEALFVNDGLLMEYDVSERAIAAKLANYLTGVFPRHHVDVEYNRHGIEPKTLHLPNGCGETGERLIIPDVVVHRRGRDDANLLVIELKKETSRDTIECDRAKVVGLKRELHYQHGMLLLLPAGQGARNRQATDEWI